MKNQSEMKKQDKPKVKMAIKDVTKKADSLMNESNAKKSFGNTQIRWGKAAIKAGNGNKVTVINLKGETTPTGKKRIDIGNKMKQSGKIDSLKSVSLRKQIKK